jgi:transcriptional regulator with XRE-family HTH domain
MPGMQTIGERIKALRAEGGMTLAELGQRSNLSVSYLSQIERDRTTPSLSTLTSVAKALNVGLRYFFETEAEAAHVVRADERSSLAAGSSIVRQRLTPDAGNSQIEVQRVTLQPGSPPEPLEQCPGEELAFVLSGQLTISIGDEQFVLAAGDSIHYDALQPRSWQNDDAEPCVVVWAHAISRTERQP